MCPVVSSSQWEFSLQALFSFEGFCNYVKLFLGFSFIPSVCTVLDHSLWVRSSVLQKHHVLLCCEGLPPCWITIRRTSSRLFRFVVFDCATMYFLFSHLHTLRHHIVPWQVGYATGRFFWIPVEDSFKKAYVEQWFSLLMLVLNVPIPKVRVMLFLRLLRCRCLSHSHHGDHRKTRTLLVLGNVLRHHCLHCSHDPHVNVWNYSSLVMLFCPATRILSHQDRINLPCGVGWDLKRFQTNTLWQISVMLFERIQSSLSLSYGANKCFSSQSPVQKRLSIYNWNPGPRRRKEDAFEKQIEVKWHIITLQEASDYVERTTLQERFHVTHFAVCAVLFNKDTFYPDISV